MTETSELDGSGLRLRGRLVPIGRQWWIVGGVTVLAVLAAALYSALATPTYRAEEELVVGYGNGPLGADAAASTKPLAHSIVDLVRSRVLATNVIKSLKLHETPASLLDRVSVSTPRPAILRLGVDDRSSRRATQIVQEVGLVFSELVALRFGHAGRPNLPPLEATVWDPAHGGRKVGPRTGRNVGLAAVLGLLVGMLAAFGRGRTWPGKRPARVPEAARPATSLGEPELREATRAAAEPEPRQPEPLPEAPPAPVTEPPGGAPAPVAEPGVGGWNLGSLERLVEEHGGDSERIEEWRYYLLYLRDHAGIDGSLPASFDSLVRETFGDLIDRARAGSRP